MLRLTFFVLALSILLSFTATATTDPVLLFSDITSGPKTGWDGSATQGAAVTIWGYNFGNTRGTSYVTVNGVDLVADTDYAVWGEHWPTQYWQRITFWLNSGMADGAGKMSVTVGSKTSNELDFTIRNGNIYFADTETTDGSGTLADPIGYTRVTQYGRLKSGLGAGDIIYYRAGTYTNRGTGNSGIIDFGKTGSATDPVAFIAYPGEKPFLNLPSSNVNFKNAVTLSGNYSVASGFRIYSEARGVYAGGNFNRVVGNDVESMKVVGQTGSIVSGDINKHTGSGNVILGNDIFGGDSKNRFDHAMYFSGCADLEGGKFGWNHIHDNDFGKGTQVVVNHQDDRCDYITKSLKAHFIFSNILECPPIRSSGIGIYDQSYDYHPTAGESEPEPTFVYNNIIVGCGVVHDPSLATTYGNDNIGNSLAISHSNGHARFYNNVLYDGGYIGFRISPISQANKSFGGNRYSSPRLSTIAKNNIFFMTSGHNNGGTSLEEYIFYDPGEETTVTLSNNLYYGLGAYSPCAGCVQDDNNVNNQDPLFVDAANDDFRLQNTSPARDAGTNSLTFEVAPPSWAPINRDFNYMLRSGNYDIGALEFVAGAVVSNSSPSTNNSPVLNSFVPNALLKMNKSMKRVFSVNVTDADNDVLTYSWLLNGSSVGALSSYEFNGSLHSNGYWNVTIIVTDGNSSVSHSWKYKLRTPKKQDITDDDVVDVNDLRIIAKHVIKKKAWRAQYDQNNDGIVNIFDLISIIKEFGTY